MNFTDLVLQYGSAPEIPNDVLYDYLETNREDILNECRLGVERVPKSNLGKEVRRRCQTDLMWLAGFFLWRSNPISENGFKPFSENIFTEEFYSPFVKLFVKKNPDKPLNKQSDVKTRVLLWPRGGAKALDTNTLIPTPNGFQKMDNIEVGDYVYGENGQAVRVIGTSPIFYNRPCYEVTFSSGETIVADEGHLWLTDAKRDRENKPRSLKRGSPTPAVKTTKQIADTLLCREERNHRVKVAEAVVGSHQDLPIPPYVLGCWLGDGTSANAQFTCDDKDSQIIDEIRKEGIPVVKTNTYLRWAFNGGENHPEFRKQKTGFSSILRSLGVTNNKHIPEIYLQASVEQRIALLQGLMDTDGTIHKGGKCYFCNTNEILATQTKELIASLGFKPSIAKGKAKLNGVVIGDAYKVFFQPYAHQPVFRLQRKLDRQVIRKKVSLQDYRTIVSVEKVESRPVKCIMVDSPSHLYLAGKGFIPTHNSTFDHCDTISWILCFPSIRILYLTAEVSLATGFVGEIKGHFYWKEDPSWMNVFWPEMCIEEGKSGAANEFTCPVYAAKKTGRKEPTVYASSNGKAKAGWRFELIKADDAVTDTNSESSTQCEKVSNRLFLSEKLLALGGYYIDYVGTRYADEDHYGVLLEQNVGDIEVTYGMGWEFHENKTRNMNVLIGRAMQIKPEVAERLERNNLPVTYKEAGPENCILLLPHLMSYNWCMEDFMKNEKSFEGQRNQNPRPASQVTFTKLLLLKATVPYTSMPRDGAVSQVWDFAFSSKKGRDYSVGTSILWKEENEVVDELDDKGMPTGQKKITGLTHVVGYVQEIVRDRFNHLTLAKAVVDLAQKFKPFVVGVEGAAGSNLLTEQIIVEARRTKNMHTIQVCSNVDWFAPDNQKDAKKTRMASLYPPIVQGRLKFANYCMQLVKAKPGANPMDFLYDEFEKCLTSHHHDDIPDNLGMQQRYAPRAQIVLMENIPENLYRGDANWNIIFDPDADQFGRIGFGQPSPTPFDEDIHFVEEDLEAEQFGGMDNVLGAGWHG